MWWQWQDEGGYMPWYADVLVYDDGSRPVRVERTYYDQAGEPAREQVWRYLYGCPGGFEMDPHAVPFADVVVEQMTYFEQGPSLAAYFSSPF